jgi:O-antigen/teichoic acid export membrane protein
VSTRKRFLGNVFWSCTNTVAVGAIGFFVTPILVHRLGATSYGLWIVLGSLTSYFGLLDLGIRASVGRHIAFHHARGDADRVRETVSSAVVLLGAVGLLAFLGVLGLSYGFLDLFDVPAEQAEAARIALVLVGASLGLSLLGDAFDAALWGLQRLDLLCAVDIPLALLRAALTLWLVEAADGLITLGLITLGSAVAAGGAKAAFAAWHGAALRARLGAVRRRAVREIFGYGIWNFLLGVARLVRGQLSPLLIGTALGVAAVTPYAIAARLVALASTIVTSATGGLLPLATQMHARGRHDEQRQFFLLGGRYSVALSLLLTTLLVLLGAPLIALWVGPELAQAAPLLTILAVGEFLPSSQLVSNKLVLAAARHRALALFGLAELVAIPVLALLLIKPLGLTGVCLAMALPATLCRGVNLVVQGCRLMGVPLGRYLAQVLLPALGCGIVPAVLLGLAAGWRAPRSWPELFLYGGAYTVLFAGASIPVLVRLRSPAALPEATKAAGTAAPSITGPVALAITAGATRSATIAQPARPGRPAGTKGLSCAVTSLETSP